MDSWNSLRIGTEVQRYLGCSGAGPTASRGPAMTQREVVGKEGRHRLRQLGKPAKPRHFFGGVPTAGVADSVFSRVSNKEMGAGWWCPCL